MATELMKVNDLIAALIKIRDEHGNIPVVDTHRDARVGGEVMSERVMEDETFFAVHVPGGSREDEFGTSLMARNAIRAWRGHDGPVLEVRSPEL